MSCYKFPTSYSCLKLVSKLATCILLAQASIAPAQTGPGGIEDTTGTSDLILWLDANQIKNVYATNNISTWADVSGYDNHCSISDGADKPNWQQSQLNGFPAVSFNGSEYLVGDLGGPINAPVTLVVVGYFGSDQTTDNDYIFSVGKTQTDGRMFSVSRRRDEGGGLHLNEHYSFNGVQPEYGPVVATGQWHIFTQYQTTSDPEHILYIDGGSAETTTNTTTNTLNADGNYAVGRWADGGSTYLDGYVAEIILFSKILNTAERNILNSHLGAKYDVTVSDDKYIGDVTPNYDYEVVGIGRETSSDQKQSAYSSGIRMEITSFSDGDYLLAGHNNIEHGINTSDAADAGGNLEARWNRSWWLDLTNGTTATTELRFDLSEAGLIGDFQGTTSDYKLLHRTGTSGDWSVSALIPVVSGDQLVFSSVNINNEGADGYYTIGTIDNAASPLGWERSNLTLDGPGGVGLTDGSSQLELWLDMSDLTGETDDFILAIEDKSGNDNHASASASFPTLVDNAINGNNAVSFDGINSKIDGSLSGGLSAPATVICAAYFDASSQGVTDNDYVISIGSNTAINEHTSISRRQSGADVDKYYAYDGTFPSNSSGVKLSDVGETIPGQEWTIVTQTHDITAPRHSAFLNGTALTVDDFAGNLSTDGAYTIGRWTIATTNYLAGDVGEVIVFDRKINSAERRVIHNYLSAKYNITITDDNYSGDGSGTGEANFDLDVTGIGSESDGSNTSATSAGIEISQNTGFDDGDYLMVGHGLSTNSTNQDDITLTAGTIEQRLERVWFFDVTDDDTSPETAAVVDIDFDFSEAGLNSFPEGTADNFKIIFRSGLTGDWTIVASGSTMSGDQVHFTNVPLSNGDGYYTIATENTTQSSLPVELISFKAFPSFNSVVFTWETASERNNAYFELQSSPADSNFTYVTRVQGHGTSNQRIKYATEDSRPRRGTSFYRLKQVDYDGATEYSKTIRVQFGGIEPVLYPNPGNGRFSILVDKDQQITQVVVRNLMGDMIQELVLEDSNEVNISHLARGIYVVEIKLHGARYFKRAVLK